MSLTWSALPIAADEDFDGAPLLRTEFALEDGHGQIARLPARHGARGVRGVPERHSGRRRRAQPGVEQLRVAAALPELRRDRHYLQPHVRCSASRSATGGSAVGWAGAAAAAYYGDELGALAQLEIEFADGHVQTVVTDNTWTAGPSAVIANDLYDGQTIDARLRTDAWLAPGFAGEAGPAYTLASWISATLTPYIGPPVRRQEELRPIKIWTSPAGQDAGRLRPEPGRLGAGPRAGAGGHDDHPPARRGARARRAGNPPAAHAPRRPTGSS